METIVELIDEYRHGDLHDLCDATEAAIEAGGGFGWLQPPARRVLEQYWKGVLLVPERRLVAARLDGIICGSAQLVRPPRNNEAQSITAHLQHSFLAPWSRGHGLARQLTEFVENLAAEQGYEVLQLDVRETQARAISLYENLGYTRWGTNPVYARVGGKRIAGHYYFKELTPPVEASEAVSEREAVET